MAALLGCSSWAFWMLQYTSVGFLALPGKIHAALIQKLRGEMVVLMQNKAKITFVPYVGRQQINYFTSSVSSVGDPEQSERSSIMSNPYSYWLK